MTETILIFENTAPRIVINSSDLMTVLIGGTAANPVRNSDGVVIRSGAPVLPDLTECRTKDHLLINAIIRNMDPGQKESDRLQVVSLIYAINTNGESISSVFNDLAHTVKYPGQFGYYARIVNNLREFGYCLELVKDTGVAGLANDIAAAGIDGFVYPDLNFTKANRFFQVRNHDSVKQEDIVQIISFLYSLLTKKVIDRIELERLLRGAISSRGTTRQYGYYPRAIKWLARFGYRIAIRKTT